MLDIDIFYDSKIESKNVFLKVTHPTINKKPCLMIIQRLIYQTIRFMTPIQHNAVNPQVKHRDSDQF